MHANGETAAQAREKQTSRWTVDHLRALTVTAAHVIPVIDPALPRPLIANLDLWDMWPAQLDDGHVAVIGGGTLWFILSSAQLADPDLRHGYARIRLLHERDGVWRDCGHALPDDMNPGSREWAGSSVYDPATRRLTLYFTAAGHRGDDRSSWAQRLFQTTGTVCVGDDGAVEVDDWSTATESVVADDVHYVRVLPGMGEPGFIKGFRDPAFFRDPANGHDYLILTASFKNGASPWNGAIGVAEATGIEAAPWRLLPPLISMDGVNNELERPHIVAHAGRYYLFFSTQTKMFAPGVPAGPNGLYGMVADTLMGPYRPLNGSGLVAANPESAPYQAYSWWVTADLVVHGFADLLGDSTTQPIDEPQWRRTHFGGVPAPRFQLILDGAASRVADTDVDAELAN